MILYLLAALGPHLHIAQVAIAPPACRWRSIRSLTGHAPHVAPAWASLVPFYEYDEDHFFSRGRGSAGSGGQPARGIHAARGHFHGAFRGHRSTGPPSLGGCDFPICSSPPRLPCAVSVQPLRAATLQTGRPARVLRRPERWTDPRWQPFFFDLTARTARNLFGYDFYKECHSSRQRSGSRIWGPVLGSYHPGHCLQRTAALAGRSRALDEVVLSICPVRRGRDAGCGGWRSTTPGGAGSCVFSGAVSRLVG